MAASFPTSIKNFSSKTNNVDDVDASHVNDLQDEVEAIEEALGAGKAASVLQIVNEQDGAVASGSTAIPYDDNIPQNTEGTELMTLAITPKSATSKLKIEVVVYAVTAVDSVRTCAALFQDTTTNALACGYGNANASANPFMVPIVFTHYMTSGTTSETTFKVRAGGSSGTTTFNGEGGSRKYGGIIASSITITEILV